MAVTRAAGPHEWCQYGLAVFRRVADKLDFEGIVLEVRVDDEELTGRAVVGEDGWAIPAGGTRPVRGLLVQQGAPVAPDGEPGGHTAGCFARASEDLFLAQYEPCGGGEVDGPGLPQVAAGRADQRLGQPVEFRVVFYGQVYGVGGGLGGGASQGKGCGCGGDVECRALLGGGFDA